MPKTFDSDLHRIAAEQDALARDRLKLDSALIGIADDLCNEHRRLDLRKRWIERSLADPRGMSPDGKIMSADGVMALHGELKEVEQQLDDIEKKQGSKVLQVRLLEEQANTQQGE